MEKIITNNPLIEPEYGSLYQITYLELDAAEILTYVRDMIHKGHGLLTHPLYGSVKPNETPYRTVLLSEKSVRKDNKECRVNTDMQSVTLIEESILALEKFPKNQINKQQLPEMQAVDMELIKTALDKRGEKH